MEEKVKKPIYKKWWFWLIIVVLLIGAFGGRDDNKQTVSQFPVTPATWQTVTTFEGNSIKDTETFHVSSNEWRINWSTEPGQLGDMNFQIYVYKDSEIPVSVAANVIGKGNDISYVRGSGDYYLKINTAQPYKIIIEEKK